MARINIENGLFQDQRFINLVIKLGDIDKAIGCLVRSWILAQKWYLKPEKFIPEQNWAEQHIPEDIITCGLAERIGNLIKVKGIDEQFSWLTQRFNAGIKSGLTRSGNRQNERPLTDVDGREPLTLSPSLSLSLNSKKKNKQKKKPPLDSLAEFDFEKLYAEYPRKIGKKKGMQICAREVKSEEDFLQLERAIKNYAAHVLGKEIRFVKHFSSFMAEWQDWAKVDVKDWGPLLPRRVTQEIERKACPRCFNEGLISVLDAKTHEMKVYACSCAAHIRPHLPVWKDELPAN
jgi:hypothetical protein